MQWKDFRLQWDPAEFAGIKDILLKQEDIWKPDIIIQNAADDYPGFVTQLDPVSAVYLSYNGGIYMASPIKFHTVCAVDTAFYPFDTQKCDILLITWFHADHYINMTWTPLNATISTQFLNPMWDIEQVAFDRSTSYEDGSGTYRTIIMDITLTRKTSFTALVIIIPCLMLTILTLVIFHLPSHSGEKITLGMEIWTSLVVFLLIQVQSVLGGSVKMPLVGLYNLILLILVTFSILLSVLGTKISAMKPPFPKWIEKFLRQMRRITNSATDSQKKESSAKEWNYNEYTETTMSSSDSNYNHFTWNIFSDDNNCVVLIL